MTDIVVCQSCSMKMTKESHFGTESDGSKSMDYCKHCYKDGHFISYNSIVDAINDSVNFAEKEGMTKDEALEHAEQFFPTLKRWMIQK